MDIRFVVPAVLAATLLSLSLSGCSGSASTGGSSSPFAGNYSGPYAESPSGQTGTYSLAINSQGGIYGTVHDLATSTFGQVNGTIDNSGNTTLNVTYINTTGVEKGVLAIAGNQHLTGSLTFGVQTETVDLTPGPI